MKVRSLKFTNSVLGGGGDRPRPLDSGVSQYSLCLCLLFVAGHLLKANLVCLIETEACVVTISF